MPPKSTASLEAPSSSPEDWLMTSSRRFDCPNQSAREAFQAPPNMGEGAAIMVIALIFIGMFMWLNVKKGRLAEGINN